MNSSQSPKRIVRLLPFLNLLNRPFRTAVLAALVTALSFVLFGGSVLAVSLQRGLSSMKARLGADIIAVPLGYDAGMESLLLKGEPSYFYLSRDYLEQISKVEGVKQVSPQLYLTSASADCCDLPVQLIGFDPSTDFTIQPWIRESHGGKLAPGSVLAGSSIEVKSGNTLTFFGREYPVAAQLDKTGTGLDSAVYADMDTLRTMMEAAQEKGFQFINDEDPGSLISSVLIKTEEGYDAAGVGRSIRSRMDGLQIVKTQSMISGMAESLGSIARLLYLFVGGFLLLALAMLALVFSVTANERKKEFAILRILGAPQKKLIRLLLAESLIISAAGGAAGIALAALTVFPFSIAIGRQFNLPYLVPDGGQITGLLLVSLVVTLLAGPLAAASSARRVARMDPSLSLREGE